MSDYSLDNISEEAVAEARRKRIEEFRASADRDAIMGDRDGGELISDSSAAQSSDDPYVNFSSDPTPLKKRRKSEEINSFSDSDTKRRIERDSRKALRQQKKEEKRIEKSKARRNRFIFKLVWLSMVIIIGIVLSQYILVGVNDMLAISRSGEPRTVTVSIPADPTIDQIADILKDSGVIKRTNFFKLYTKLTSSVDGFRQGDFKLSTNKDYEAIINTLQSNSNRTDIVTVQITEGMSVVEIANLLNKERVTADVQNFLDICNSDVFDEDYTFLQSVDNADERYYKLEGYLFPDTYDFYVGEDPKLTVSKMLDNYEARMISHKEKYFGNSKRSTLEQEALKTGYSTDEILTIASIIQAEAANKEDMYYISSILHNRLEYGVTYGVSKLNCDCTVYYPYREYEDVPESIRATYSSRYDTNTFDGLPPGPICNPGIEAIKAAINPYETSYLYFCHDTPDYGSTPYYSTTLEEHESQLDIIKQHEN